MASKWALLGQDRPVNFLDAALKNDALSHAYLFSGPRHVGKMTLALKLAQALNCEDEERPCGQCSSCRRIAEGKHADIQTVSLGLSKDDKARTEIGIDQIREIQRAASLKPFEGKYRVIIIEDAERLSGEAANCLLKTLEEPPPNVMILILTSNERLLLPTVISRCQKLELKPVAVTALEKALIEGHGVAPERARLLARVSEGRPGLAIGAARDERVLEEREKQLTLLTDLATANLGEGFSFAARLAQQFSKSRESVRDTLNLWIGWWRDLLLAKGGCPSLITNVDREESIRRLAAVYSLTQIHGFIKNLRLALSQLEQNANSRLVLETLLLNLPRTALAESSGEYV